MMLRDSAIDKNSIVRIIDVFVNLPDLKQIGFIVNGQIKKDHIRLAIFLTHEQPYNFGKFNLKKYSKFNFSKN